MKKIIFLIFCMLWCQIVDAQPVSAVEKHGSLRVENGSLVNKDRQPPALRGISMSWSIWGGKKYYNPEVVSWLKKDFEVTLLRVSMAIEHDGGYLKDSVGQEKLIIATIDAAIEQGIYVLIDWHDHHADAHVLQSRNFFGRMARKYAGIPNVIYEIWNEPEKIGWPVIKHYAEDIIAEIRKYDKSNVIVVGSSSWDQDVDVAAKDPIRGFENIAYSFHFYASDPNHQEKLMNKAEVAMKAGLALFVTEWGVGESNGNGVFDLGKTNKWMDWMEQHQLSWANWNLTDKKETTALLEPGASAVGNWAPTDLSPAGAYIRTQLKKLN
ncbi:MAG TPA: glycoside hydrolase family 5 protein [Pedobacter sp.]|nr:glycoside hydrolase family 5 protein [Pedobacter sp.]